jgi:hypothetical protein
MDQTQTQSPTAGLQMPCDSLGCHQGLETQLDDGANFE